MNAGEAGPAIADQPSGRIEDDGRPSPDTMADSVLGGLILECLEAGRPVPVDRGPLTSVCGAFRQTQAAGSALGARPILPD